jgi:molecular chaperone DnaK
MLGQFNLEDIPPAPRGMPQIEVTFDIDANGIVHVQAKDKATGKEQKITITGTTALSDEEIDRMVDDADSHAEEDKKMKEAAEARNNADTLVYQSEKTLSDLGDKVSDELKGDVETAIAELKTALEGEDTDVIAAGTQKLQEAGYKLAEIMYADAQADGAGEGPVDETVPDDDDEEVVEADYEVVDGDE